MTILFHELKQNRISLLVWTLVVSFMLCISVFVYPEMKGQMSELGDMFSDMGAFTSGFGMDELNFGEFKGYFAIECGNVLGIGGAFFAAILGIASLAKEEKDRTSEFLLTHPVSRFRVAAEKYLSLLLQLFIFNFSTAAFAFLSVKAIGEALEPKSFLLLFFAYYLLECVIASVSFGISAFLKGGGMGIGIGLAVVLYFANILSNLTDELEVIKYFTPFSFVDGAKILNETSISASYLIPSLIFAVCFIVAAFFHYPKKDIS